VASCTRAAAEPPVRARARDADRPTAPEVWLLGSSDQSAALAAHLGTGFSFAHFINQEGGAEVTRAYRQAFRPSAWLDAPRASAAVFVVCADTEAAARRLAKSRELFIVRLYTGRPGRYPSIEEAESYPYTERELAILRHAQGARIAGTPEQVRERLEALAADYERTSSSSSRSPTTRRRGAGPTSSWPRSSGSRKRARERASPRNLRAALATVTLLAGLGFAFRGTVTAQRPVDTPRFQVDPGWPKPLPRGWVMGQAAGVAVDRRGHVWSSSARARSPRALRRPPCSCSTPTATCCAPGAAPAPATTGR